jgi:hypothetical protein
MVARHLNSAAWLTQGYLLGPSAEAVLANANAGAEAYPMLPHQGPLHTALGAELSSFLQGCQLAKEYVGESRLTTVSPPE